MASGASKPRPSKHPPLAAQPSRNKVLVAILLTLIIVLGAALQYHACRHAAAGDKSFAL
jgi:hypothetical protein